MHPIPRARRSLRRALFGLSMALPTAVGCGGTEPAAAVTKEDGPSSLVDTPAPKKPAQPKVDVQ